MTDKLTYAFYGFALACALNLVLVLKLYEKPAPEFIKLEYHHSGAVDDIGVKRLSMNDIIEILEAR
jgi:hypothetical protein